MSGVSGGTKGCEACQRCQKCHRSSSVRGYTRVSGMPERMTRDAKGCQGDARGCHGGSGYPRVSKDVKRGQSGTGVSGVVRNAHGG